MNRFFSTIFLIAVFLSETSLALRIGSLSLRHIRKVASSLIVPVFLIVPPSISIDAQNHILTTAPIAHAGFALFQSAEQNKLDEISSFQKPVDELLSSLRPTMQPNPIGVFSETQLLKGGYEDSNVVLNYKSLYLEPLQVKMEEFVKLIISKDFGDEESKNRLKSLPLLMKGHLLELDQAIKSQKASEQAKEVEEVQETLAEFLKLCSLNKFSVTPYVPTRPLTDKELFGPLGCEFWGKQRVPGSNACVYVEN